MFLLFCIEIPLGFFLGHKIMNIMLDNIKLPTLLASLLRHIGHQLPWKLRTNMVQKRLFY